jgi:hypothetical protein
MIPGSYALRVGEVVVSSGEGGISPADRLIFRDPDAPGERKPAERTTVGVALARLRRAGFESAKASRAQTVVRSRLARNYIRGPIAAKVIEHLEALELFEHRGYVARTRTYNGTWLDLKQLARDTGLSSAADTMHGLHLAALLKQCDAEATVSLSAGEPIDNAAGTLEPEALTVAFEQLAQRPPRSEPPADAGPSVVDLLRSVRARTQLPFGSNTRARLVRLDDALIVASQPGTGPLANSALWRLEVRLALGEVDRVLDALAMFERTHGPSGATAYLRAYATFLIGKRAPAEIADEISVLATRDPFPQLMLLAARAFAAAGDAPQSLRFARALLSQIGAPAQVREHAAALADDLASGRQVQLEGTRPTSTAPGSSLPASTPPAEPGYVMPVRRSTPVPSTYSFVDPKAPLKRRSSAPRPSTSPPKSTTSTTVSAQSDPPPIIEAIAEVSLRAPRAYIPEVMPATSAQMVVRPDRIGVRASEGPQVESQLGRHVAGGREDAPRFLTDEPMAGDLEVMAPSQLETGKIELLHQLTAPEPSIDPEGFSANYAPRSGAEARAIFTNLTRELALEMNARFGVTLRVHSSAVAVLQKNLRQRLKGKAVTSEAYQHEVRRHAACFSELVIRVIGGQWIDMASPIAADWALFVVPATRTWPFASVAHFAAQQDDRDLVSYYLALELRALRARGDSSR